MFLSPQSDPQTFMTHTGSSGRIDQDNESPIHPFAPAGGASDADLLNLFLSTATGSDAGNFWQYNDVDQNLWQYGGMDPAAPSVTPALDWLFPEPFGDTHVDNNTLPAHPIDTYSQAPGDQDIAKAVQPDDGDMDGRELQDGQPKGNIWVSLITLLRANLSSPTSTSRRAPVRRSICQRLGPHPLEHP